ncbi:MAG: hypothetical protein D6826_02810 [Alphaproteobacteria bacterium]|nr:MAG: hypothetical protein D6826_02810 [Alphaproteobacteria bacterium]
MENLNPATVVSTIVVLAFAGLVFAAAISDVLRYIVPNRLCLAVCLLYPVHILSATRPVSWQDAVLIAVLALVAGFALFAWGKWGGGDAKLFAAVALWAGPSLFLEMALITSLAGGVMALFIWLQHRLARAPGLMLALAPDPDPDFDIMQAQIPYGAAIAVGALYVAFTLLKVG